MHIRPLPFFLFAAVLAAQAPTETLPPAAPASLEPPAAMTTIGKDELLKHASFLASDELQGRLTGSPGQLAAATYIQKHFAALGLEPLGDEKDGVRGWHQDYGVRRTYVTTDTKLAFGGLALTDGFAVLGGQAQQFSHKGALRFCGLGRVRGDAADVGADESLAGVVAVVVARTPKGRVDGGLTVEQKFGMSFQTFNQMSTTAKALAKKGAAAVVFVQLQDRYGLSDVLNYLAVAPGKDSLQARFAGGEDGMGGLGAMLGGGGSAPTFVLSQPASAKLLGELGLQPDAVAAFVAGSGERPVAKDGVVADLTLGVAVDEAATACNVVAVLRGSDPELSKEAIVYSAHMDHVGTRIDGEVFNGADDNASGSSGLLAIATAYAKSAAKPKRSVIFLSVSGEELGLWGSAYYADNPTWPADRIVANVNTDMIGRSGPESGANEVTVTPSHKHNMFSTIVRDAAVFADSMGIKFSSGDKYYKRSDHYNFAKKGIPVVFFCNGEHEDYHQVSDHADKLDGAKMERIARLAFWTGWAVANADEKPAKLGKQPAWR
jgi:hypothetical protein